MDDLWFDLAIRGETDLQDAVVKRFHLSDGIEPDCDAERPAQDAPAQDDEAPPATDCC